MRYFNTLETVLRLCSQRRYSFFLLLFFGPVLSSLLSFFSFLRRSSAPKRTIQICKRDRSLNLISLRILRVTYLWSRLVLRVKKKKKKKKAGRRMRRILRRDAGYGNRIIREQRVCRTAGLLGSPKARRCKITPALRLQTCTEHIIWLCYSAVYQTFHSALKSVVSSLAPVQMHCVFQISNNVSLSEFIE